MDTPKRSYSPVGAGERWAVSLVETSLSEPSINRWHSRVQN